MKAEAVEGSKSTVSLSEPKPRSFEISLGWISEASQITAPGEEGSRERVKGGRSDFLKGSKSSHAPGTFLPSLGRDFDQNGCSSFYDFSVVGEALSIPVL